MATALHGRGLRCEQGDAFQSQLLGIPDEPRSILRGDFGIRTYVQNRQSTPTSEKANHLSSHMGLAEPDLVGQQESPWTASSQRARNQRR
jgi:hypothetical protein